MAVTINSPTSAEETDVDRRRANHPPPLVGEVVIEERVELLLQEGDRILNMMGRTLIRRTARPDLEKENRSWEKQAIVRSC